MKKHNEKRTTGKRRRIRSRKETKPKAEKAEEAGSPNLVGRFPGGAGGVCQHSIPPTNNFNKKLIKPNQKTGNFFSCR
jgi:hypothetical protein